jgi:hypothetical protein
VGSEKATDSARVGSAVSVKGQIDAARLHVEDRVRPARFHHLQFDTQHTRHIRRHLDDEARPFASPHVADE